jgi:hypothetical protein
MESAGGRLFVDQSQIVQVERLRAGIRRTDDIWGRMLAFQPSSASPDEERPRA